MQKTEDQIYREQHYDDMLVTFRRGAETGDPEKIKIYADFLYSGRSGRDQNVSAALPHWVEAAKRGNVNAQFTLGCIYADGHGVRRDLSLADKYFYYASMANHRVAQYRLALVLKELKDLEFLHWLCCAHINGFEKATQALNMEIRARNCYDTVNQMIAEIKRSGLDPKNNMILRATQIYREANNS